VAKALCSDAQFIAAWNETGGKLGELADRFGFSNTRAVSNRRLWIEKRHKITLYSAAANSSRNTARKREHTRRIEIRADNATILVVSDVHRWPGPLTTAQRGAIALCKRLKPTHKVINGDLFDGAKISRFPPAIWAMEERPKVAQELEACLDFTVPFSQASPNGEDIWLLGNHDMRMEGRLAAVAPEYEGVPGFHLEDHFPGWKFGMAMFVNDELVIKHRIANGIHAVYNNTVKSGRSIVTGHLHSLKVTPWTDYNGTRYGVDTGTLADPEGPQFDYAEENPLNHRSGFAVLTIKDGRLMMPELCQVWDANHVEFRGELIPV
jgi:hypothetical protein